MMASPIHDLRYQMVVFDVGGTLLGFHERAAFQKFLAHAGLPAADDDARRLHHRLVSVILAERDKAQGLGADERELNDWWYGNFSKTWPHRPDLAAEMFRWLLEGRFDQPFGDTLPTLQALQRLGVPMAVISNFGTQLRGLLERLCLLRYFEFVIVSAEVVLAKPDPRIFELAVSKAGVPPDRLLYVGDHVGDDVEGAWGAGLDAVLIDRRDRQPDVLCPRISSLLELVEYVHKPTRPAHAVVFDMDGVVLDSMPAHLATWQRALAPLGIDMTADDLYPLEGVPTERTAQLLTERFLGKPCSDEEAKRLAGVKRTLFREIFEPTLVPGILPLLYDLRGRGFRLGLVTGSAQSVVDDSLAALNPGLPGPTRGGFSGVAGPFDVVVTGDRVSRGKPDPEPYEIAAARLGLPPSACLVVENSPLGIQSAKGAGMACVALQTTLPAPRLSAAGADKVFADVRALRAWLLSR